MSNRFGQTRRVVTTVAPPVAEESIRWRVVRLLEFGGRREIAAGEQTYYPYRDVAVKPVKGSVVDARTVSVPLGAGFALSVSVCKAPLDGFGLFISRPADAHGFSWEWFDRDGAVVFKKRQGDGRVTVDVTRGPGYEELAAVEFLDEIVLRYLDNILKPPGTISHEIVIGKGSVFKFDR
jgi:hypothetical protein